MKPTPNHTLLAGFVAALALLGIVAGFNWRQTIGMRETAEWVAHTERVRGELDRLLLQMQDIESDGRGFVVTGDPAFLEPFEASVGKVKDQFHKVRILTSDNPRQQANCQTLEPLIDRRVAQSRAVVELRRNSGYEAARQEIAKGVGKAAMDQVRAVIGRMESEEQRLLVQRTAAARHKTDTAQRLMFFGTGLSFALLIAVFGLVLRENRLRQRAQAMAEKSSAEMHDLYNNAPCGYHSVNVEGVFQAMNDTELAWLGYAPEELIGKKKHSDLVSPETKAAYAAGIGTFRETGEVRDLEFELIRKNGSRMDVLLNATAVRDAEGRILHSRSTMFDITARRKAEKERDRFFTISLDLLGIAGMDGHFKRANPAFAATLGWSAEEIAARPFLDFIHPDDRASTVAEVKKLSQGVPTLQFENRYQCKDGSYKWISWKCQPFPSEGLLYASGRDITERKHAEAQIFQLNADLQGRAAQLGEANKELESFSYSISHDLRAPLRHVQGYIEMLHRATDGTMSEKAQRYLKIVTAASVEMGQLIDDLLAFSKMGRSEMIEMPVPLEGLVQETIAGLEMATRDRNIAWKITALPRVIGDSSMLKQVLANIVGNAVKYSRTRNPAQIEIGCAGREDGQVILFVRDNGVGFDMQYAHKLFGVFQRLHRAEEFEGTGIGLATVRRVISRHGGRVWAESKLNEGSTFYFTLKPVTKD